MEAIWEQLKPGGTVVVLCGSGNNGGDGLAILRQLAMRNVKVRAILLAAPEKLTGDALLQYNMAVGSNLPIQTVLTAAEAEAVVLSNVNVLVDAMFGTGLSRPVEDRYLAMIKHVNASKARVVAVDIPSGVDGATGHVLGAAVRADITVTFQHKKIGHLLFPGRALAGKVRVSPIGPINPPPNSTFQLEREDVQALLPKREQNTHKGTYGRALLCGGSEQYAGAALLCAKSALRAGSGLLHTAVPRGIRPMFAACPDAICHPAGTTDEWDHAAAQDAIALLEPIDAAAVGPGMGKGSGIPVLLQAALESKKPLVIDADGLNAIAANPELLRLLHENVVLTPHPAEMGRLIGKQPKEIAENPLETVRKAAQDWSCTVLLKGATSVIAQGRKLCLNTTGNPGLAKGGSGDVLTGIILALLAQRLLPFDAACAGAYLLGSTADLAYVMLGMRMLTPSDIVEAFDFDQ